MNHRDANFNVNEGQSLVWEELSRSRRPKVRAGHFYEAPRTTSNESLLRIGRKAWTWPVVVGAPLAVAVIIALVIAF